ncbi:MAG: hypothetical protein DRQ14_08070 [Candidatus Latescibacterota bacterium]|nr:MAG: hypothetical protein DRQ14_08070 [Candidatus Latescibacterota bacterium]
MRHLSPRLAEAMRRGRLRDALWGEFVSDADVDILVGLGFDEDDVIEALSDSGHELGLDGDGRNEWWPIEERRGA